MRPVLVVLVCAAAACQYHGRAVDDGAPIDAPDESADGGADANGVVAWTVDTRDDFIDPGADVSQRAVLFGVAAADRGVIEPVAYVIGGLLGRASNSQLFTTETEPWSTLATADANPATTIDDPSGDYGTGFPVGLGITSGDSYTVWWEGEVFLEAGNHQVYVQSDDWAFMEIDVGGVQRAQDNSAIGSGAINFSVPADGYYPIRAALDENSGTSQLLIFHQAPGQAGFGILSAGRLRVRANELAGVLRHGFDDMQLGSPSGTTRAEVDFLDENYGSGYPDDVGITDHDTWSQRLTGQFWLDATVIPTIHVTSDDGYRVVLDGTVLDAAAAFDASGHDDMLESPIVLDRGWHDLAIDHQDVSGNTDLAVAIGAPPVAVVAKDLRPVSTSRERIASGIAVPGAVTIDGFKQATIDAGRLTDAVEYSITYELDHTNWSELTVTLTAPWGATALIRDHVPQSGNGDQVVTQIVPATLVPENPGSGTRPVSGLWSLAVADTASPQSGSLIQFAITARYKGGPGAIEPESRWVSGVHDFGTARSISGVTRIASTPTGSAVTITLRTCDALPCTGNFVSTAAMTFPLPPTRYAQLAVDATSNGTASWFVDAIDVYVLP